MKRLYTTILILGASLVVSSTAYGEEGLKFEADLSRDQEVPTAVGGNIIAAEVEAEFDDAFTQVDVRLRVEGGENVTRAHFHCARPGQNGPIAFGLFSPGPLVFDGEEAEGTLTNADFTGADCVPLIGRPVNNIVALVFAMRDGLIYTNVHTTDNPSGEVRGQMLED